MLAGCLATCAAFAVYAAHTALKHGLFEPPAINTDATDYDAIGWSLAHGHGFSIDYTAPEFRSRYGTLATDLPSQNHGPVAYRPPLYPLLLSVGERLPVSSFAFGRVLNAAAIAAAAGICVGLAARILGIGPAVIAWIQFVLIDYRTRVAVRELLSESLACLLVGGMLLTLIGWQRRPRWTYAAGLGLIAGTSVLLRSIFVLWLPGLLVTLLLLLPRERRFSRQALCHSVLFLAMAAAVVSPWAIRNVAVLQSWRPLGTQGQMQLPAGYSDAAVRNGGVWFPLDNPEADALRTPGHGLAWELAVTKHNGAEAKDWIIRNPHWLPPLAAMKLFHELRPHGPGELYILAFAAIGLLILRNRPDSWAYAGLVLSGLFSVAVTWSVHGRFLVPLLPVLHVLAAVGVWMSVRTAWEQDRLSAEC